MAFGFNFGNFKGLKGLNSSLKFNNKTNNNLSGRFKNNTRIDLPDYVKTYKEVDYSVDDDNNVVLDNRGKDFENMGYFPGKKNKKENYKLYDFKVEEIEINPTKDGTRTTFERDTSDIKNWSIDAIVLEYHISNEEAQRVKNGEITIDELFSTNYKEYFSKYLNSLEAAGLIELDDDTRNKILSLNNAAEAFKLINEKKEECINTKAYYYNYMLGVPLTQEFLDLLSHPNVEDSREFLDYMNSHYMEFSDKYIEFQKGLCLTFTDEQISILRSIGTFEEAQKYLAEIMDEAGLRYLARDEAYQDYRTECINLYGIDPEKIDERIAYLKEHGDPDNQIEKLIEMRNRINERTEFYMYNSKLLNSSEIDNVSLSATTDSFHILVGGINGDELLSISITTINDRDYYVVTFEVFDNGNFQTVTKNIPFEEFGAWLENANLMLYIEDPDGNKKSINQLTEDGKPNFDLTYNMLTYVNLYDNTNKSLSGKFTDKDDLLWYLFETADNNEFRGALTDENSYYRAYAAVMTEREMKAYCYIFNTKGAEKAHEYLVNLSMGSEFQERLVSYYAQTIIEKFSTLKIPDYSSLKELTSNELQEMAKNGDLENYNIITNYDDEGNIHYYVGKEGTVYFLKCENGENVYYEVTPNGDGWALNDMRVFGQGMLSGFREWGMGIERTYTESDGVLDFEQRVDLLVQEAVTTVKHGGRAYTLGVNYGKSLPTRLLSKIPGIGSALAFVGNAASNTGNTKDGAINQGYSKEEAWNYAIASGTVEATIDLITKGISSKYKLNIGTFDKSMDKYFAYSLVKSYLGGASDYTLDLVFKRMFLNEDFSDNFNLKDMGDAALNSMLFTAMLNAYKIPNDVNAVKNMLAADNSEVGQYMAKTGVSAAEARKTFVFAEVNGLDFDTAYNVQGLMKEYGLSKDAAMFVDNIMGRGFSKVDAMSIYGMMLNGIELNANDILNIKGIINRGLNVEEAADVNQLMKDEGLDIDTAINRIKPQTVSTDNLDNKFSEEFLQEHPNLFDTGKTNKKGEKIYIERVNTFSAGMDGGTDIQDDYFAYNEKGEQVAQITVMFTGNKKNGNAIELDYQSLGNHSGEGNVNLAVSSVIEQIFVNGAYNDMDPLVPFGKRTDVKEIRLSINSDNAASRHIAESNGFNLTWEKNGSTQYVITKDFYLAKNDLMSRN